MSAAQKKKRFHYKLLQEKIAANTGSINIQQHFISHPVDIGTDIDVNKFVGESKIIDKTYQLNYDQLDNEPVKTTRYLLLPTPAQETVLKKWFNAYIDMYNSVTELIKNEFTSKT